MTEHGPFTYELQGGIFSSAYTQTTDRVNPPQSLTVESFMDALEAVWSASSQDIGRTIFVTPATFELMKLWNRFWETIKALFGRKTPNRHQLRKITWPVELRDCAAKAVWS